MGTAAWKLITAVRCRQWTMSLATAETGSGGQNEVVTMNHRRANRLA